MPKRIVQFFKHMHFLYLKNLIDRSDYVVSKADIVQNIKLISLTTSRLWKHEGNKIFVCNFLCTFSDHTIVVISHITENLCIEKGYLNHFCTWETGIKLHTQYVQSSKISKSKLQKS